MKVINKIADVLDSIIRIACVAMILSVFVVTVAQVVVRKLGGTLSWADELSRYLVVIMVIYGAVLSARRGTGIRITVFLNRLPDKIRKWVEVLEYALVFVFMVVTTYSMFLGCINLGAQTLGIMTFIQLSWIYWLLFAGLILMDIYLILYIITVIQKGVAKEEIDETLFEDLAVHAEKEDLK